MRDYPRKATSSLITYVIAIGLVLRSLIAPGFMLDASDGLAIIFCEGPAGVYSQKHHGGHHDHHNEAGPDDQQRHFTPSCTHWSTSGLLVINSVFAAAVFPATPVLQTRYQSPFIHQYSSTLRPNRGPPFLTA